jgi:hypothetical protein
MEKEIRKQDDAAVAKAKESPMPDQYELFTNVYVNDCGLESGSTMNRRPQPRRRHPRAGQGGCYQGRRFQQRFGSATKSRITCWIERRLLQPQVEHVPQHHQSYMVCGLVCGIPYSFKIDVALDMVFNWSTFQDNGQ